MEGFLFFIVFVGCVPAAMATLLFFCTVGDASFGSTVKECRMCESFYKRPYFKTVRMRIKMRLLERDPNNTCDMCMDLVHRDYEALQREKLKDLHEHELRTKEYFAGKKVSELQEMSDMIESELKRLKEKNNETVSVVCPASPKRVRSRRRPATTGPR